MNKRGAGAVFLLVLTAYAAGIFVFDLGLVVFRQIRPDGSTILTNASGLAPCFQYALFALIGLVLLSILGGRYRARKKGQGAGEGFIGQAWTFAPGLALAFGRFADGKAVHFIFPIPLFPLLAAGVLLAILYRNARFHWNFRLRSWVVPQDEARRKRLLTLVWGVVLASFLAHLMTLNPFFPRYSSYMLFAGDEPKYLRMAYSLASEGDVDLTDDFVGNDVEVSEWIRAARAAGSRKIGDYSVLGRDGGIYHFHMPGISSLILPPFLLDLKAYPRDIPNTQPLMFLPAKMVFTRAWLMAIAIVFFLLLGRFYNRLFSSRLLAGFLLLALVFATKIPEFLLQVYPETAAGICLFLGLNALFFPFSKAWANRLALIAGIGFLPWLHQRFVPLALSLYLLFLFQARGAGRRKKDILSVSAALAAIGIGYAAYFYFLTGNPMPWSLYSLWGTSYTRAAIFPSGFFGYLFDTRSGLLAQYPIFLFALIGFYWGLKRERRTTGKLLAVILPYFGLICITPWHGIAWETTRMSLILFPLFLVFVGFTIRSLSDDTSWAHLLFYGAALTFLLLNKGGRFWEISLGNVLILPHQVGYIIQGALVFVLFYLLLWALDRATRQKLGVLPVSETVRKLREAGGRLRRAPVRPSVRKGLTGLILAVPVLYGLVYLNNWRDKTLAQSYFSSLAKIRRLSDIRLFPRDQPSPGLAKTDDAFGSLFPRAIPFELSPGKEKHILRFGPAPLLEKCPAGRYWMAFEFPEAPAEFTAFYLDFMGETRKIVLESRPGTNTAAATFILFEDLFISPQIVFRFSSPLGKAVRGIIRFSPIPCAVFDRRLIVTRGDDFSPQALRTVGPHTYLTLTAIAREPYSDFVLDLSLLESAAGRGENVRFLRSYRLDLGKSMGRRFNIPVDFDGRPLPAGASLSLSISDGAGRRLNGTSVFFPAGDPLRLKPSRGGTWSDE